MKTRAKATAADSLPVNMMGKATNAHQNTRMKRKLKAKSGLEI